MTGNDRKTALITGTSSGFGMLFSVALAKDGYQVIATMRNLDKRSKLLELAARHDVLDMIHLMQLDVTREPDIQTCIETVLSSYGHIDVLVNNAGIAVGGFVEDVPMSDWKKQFETNVFGVIACTKAVVPHMRARQQGTIINISSVSGRMGLPALGPYSASKFAVEGFSESLRLELLPYNIHVCLVEPGPFKTEIWDTSLVDMPIPAGSAYTKQAESMMRMLNHTIRRAGNPHEVVDVVRRIVSNPHPKLRYPVGKGTRFGAIAKAVLPWSFIERAVQKRM